MREPYIDEEVNVKKGNQFKLIIQGRTVKEFNRFTLSGEVREWGPNYESYMILEPVEPIQGSVFLQARLDKNKSKYIVEVRFETEQTFTHYQYCTENGGEVVKLFWEYYEDKKAPNVQDWTDISEQLR